MTVQMLCFGEALRTNRSNTLLLGRLSLASCSCMTSRLCIWRHGTNGGELDRKSYLFVSEHSEGEVIPTPH